MKRFSLGLLTGLLAGLILATATLALASQPIKLIVNGKEIQCDVPPQIINGRVLVPARFVAEPLGAKVEWDEQGQAVVVTKQNSSIPSPSSNFSQPTVPDVYSVNQIIEFPNATIKVTGIRYSNRYNEFVASNKTVFALLEMDIFPKTRPIDRNFWAANSFIGQWNVNNEQIIECFTTGDSSNLETNKWNHTVIVTEIPNNKRITSIIVRDPISSTKNFAVVNL